MKFGALLEKALTAHWTAGLQITKAKREKDDDRRDTTSILREINNNEHHQKSTIYFPCIIHNKLHLLVLCFVSILWQSKSAMKTMNE
jgi:hypothetical protein